jgi:hypothetical protein
VRLVVGRDLRLARLRLQIRVQQRVDRPPPGARPAEASAPSVGGG